MIIKYLQVDRGNVDKQRAIRKRELYDEEPEEEEELTELQKTLLMDVEDEEEVLPDETEDSNHQKNQLLLVNKI